MFKYFQYHFVYNLLFLIILGYAMPSLAALTNENPITVVKTADYQIGDDSQTITARNKTAIQGQLVSLYSGESGDSVPERGYLTDVVWGDKTADTQKSQNIIYYSFNVGQWKRKLNSQTSVLTRAFMTQPLLVFLSDTDKAAIAAQLITTPLFSQAVKLYKAQVANSVGSSALLDDTLMALGEKAVAQLNQTQKQSSGANFQARMIAQKTKLRTALARDVSKTGISFNDASQTFNIFQGMDINGSKTIDASNQPQLDFMSNSALYYGVQELTQFSNPKGFNDILQNHFINLNLIEPVTGFVGENLFNGRKPTTIALDTLMPGNSINVAVFRNNPYLSFDAPTAMNILTFGATITEAIVGVVNPKLIKQLMGTVQNNVKRAKDIIEDIALISSVVRMTQILACSADNDEGLCKDYNDKIKKVTELIAKPLSVLEDSFKNTQNEAESNISGSFCGGDLIKNTLTAKFLGRPDKNSFSKRIPKKQLAICAFDYVATKKLLALAKANLSATEYDKFNRTHSSIVLTANFLKRQGWKITGVPAVSTKYQLETLVAKLTLQKGVNLINQKMYPTNALNFINDNAKFFTQVTTGKVDMSPLLGQLVEGIDKYLQGALSTVIYDVLKAVTPAKIVQLATAANNVGALVYDWITDPTVIKLTMTKTSDNNGLTISHAIPEIKGIPYLKIPRDDYVVDYSDGLENINNGTADNIFRVSNAPDTNHLLVYSGFKASVENQSAFLSNDHTTVNSLLNNGNIAMKWHVKRFASSAEIAPITCTEKNNIACIERTAANAFNGSANNIDKVLKSSFWWWKNPIIDLKKSFNPLHHAILGSDLSNYEAIDFTKFYQTISKTPYPLTHKTTGIYSDYTHIKIKTGNDEKLYQNTFNVYVLPDWNNYIIAGQTIPVNLDNLLRTNSKRYCDDTLCTKNAEIQLNFTVDAWKEIGNNGLWAVWISATDGHLITDPIALGKIVFSGSTAGLRIPQEAGLNDYLVIYDDVLNGYLKHSGHSITETLQRAVTQYRGGHYPIIALKPSELDSTSISLLKPSDRDADGIPDNLDAFPDNFNYTFDSDGDQMPDEYEEFYGLNEFIDDSALDTNNNGISNLNEFIAQTDPTHLGVTVEEANNQVKLTWTKPLDTATQSICWAAKPLVLPVNNCVTTNNSGATLLVNQKSPAVIKALTNGKAYYFAVIVQDNTGKLIMSKLLTATPNKPLGLNDTGITTCSDNSNNNLPCPVTGFANQDAEKGRDVLQNDVSNGHAGFNFTKIDSAGKVLPANATTWQCVKDNVTGLMWEIKTDDAGLHDKDWRYSWYNPDNSNNGGFAGYQNYGNCNNTSRCDTDGFVNAVNTAGWCGYNDWRLPTVDELTGIASLDRYYPTPSIDNKYFPETQWWYWSASPVAYGSGYAWMVYFYNGFGDWYFKYYYDFVRLVRAGQ